MDEQPFDAGNEHEVKKRRTKDKLRRETEVEDLKKLLATKEGRRFIWKILQHCNIYENSFTGNSTTFFKEGRRDIGLWLLTELHYADKTAYANLQLEAAKQEEN